MSSSDDITLEVTFSFCAVLWMSSSLSWLSSVLALHSSSRIASNSWLCLSYKIIVSEMFSCINNVKCIIALEYMLPVQGAVPVSHFFSISPCTLLQHLHLSLQPLSLSLVLLCLQVPLCLPSGPMLTSLNRSVFKEQELFMHMSTTSPNR